VGCEACHGPGQAHLFWAGLPDAFDRERWLDVDARGWTRSFIAGDAASEINLCAACHSRREPLGADSPPPGAAFDDHYRLMLLRDGLYYRDGQIHDEVYVYGSFLQSKMYAKGVRCTDCHEPHSYALKLQGNELCTQCHQPRGHPAFPSLTKAEYDTPAHHFHEQGSVASACRSCHMPETNYMVVDARADHSFRVPRPDLSEKLDSPDLCTQCHQGETPEWAAKQIRVRFPQGRSDEPHFGEVFAAAVEAMTADISQQLIVMSTNHDLPAIVRATALQLQPPTAASDPAVTERLAGLLSDDSALVRAAAVGVQRGLRSEQGIKRLATMLTDPSRSVRIETAKAFLGVPPGAIPQEYQVSLREAMDELQVFMRAKTDFPEGQLVILYTGIFKFDGRLDRVIITVSDENTVPPRKLPAVYY
jgi:predicted CXXCH cytochrome family protein